MVVKEEISLLPSSVKSLPGASEGNVSIKRSFHWLLIATLALMFGWLVLLSVRSFQPALSEELVNSLMRGQEARDRRQIADNTALMQSQDNNKQIDQLRTEIDDIKAETSPLLQLSAKNSHLIEQLRFVLPVVMLVRKQCENPTDYFDKTFAEYQEGFSANGEGWIGLDKLHHLTSEHSYSLKITMTDYDGKKYRAVYEQFEVGPGNNYVLTVGKFNAALSTLGDSMAYHNGMKFSTKDRDQDGDSGRHCAKAYTGGWWYKNCMRAHPTGLSSATKKNSANYGYNYVKYFDGGERGNSWDSWSRAEYLLVPN